MTQRAAILGLLIIILGVPHAFGLTAVRVSPDPDYPLTTDDNDLLQLTDGKLVSYPMWTDRNAVGWSNASPVIIMLNLSSSEQNASSARLRLHSSVGRVAGVNPIYHVDVYSANSSGNSALHVGQYQNDSLSLDQSNYFVDINLNKTLSNLFVVVHVPRGGVFLDEISLENTATPAPNPPQLQVKTNSTATATPATSSVENAGTTPPANEPAITGLNSGNIMSALSSDSSQRIKTIYTSALTTTNFAKIQASSGAALQISPVDCFGLYPADLVESTLPPLFVSKNLRWEGQRCYKIINTSTSQQTLQITHDNDLTIYDMQPIVLRNGTSIRDALIPLSNNSFTLQSAEEKFIWVDYQGDGASSQKLNVSIAIQDSTYDVVIPTQSVNCAIAPRLDLNVWSYTKNQPIWNNKDKALATLLDAGVSQFTIHPGYMPSLIDGKPWSLAAKLALSNELARYGQAAKQYFFVTAWNKGRDYQTTLLGSLDSKSSQNLTLWIQQLNQFISSYKIDKKKIILYPVDEPFGDKWDNLSLLAREIKKLDPELQVYANPTQESQGTATLGQLNDISPYINVWQPHWDFARSSALSFFQKLGAAWWIYDIPNYPARFSPPDTQYRVQAWRAWAIGASGIGMWSFDSTRGDSTWDDFDGQESDAAMVYESTEFGIVESRRWKALKRGLSDVQILSATQRANLKARILNNSLTGQDMQQQFQQAAQTCNGSN